MAIRQPSIFGAVDEGLSQLHVLRIGHDRDSILLTVHVPIYLGTVSTVDLI
jgi:hypothetical protein